MFLMLDKFDIKRPFGYYYNHTHTSISIKRQAGRLFHAYFTAEFGQPMLEHKNYDAGEGRWLYNMLLRRIWSRNVRLR